MSYRIAFYPRARVQFEAFPAELQAATERALERLARSPTTYSVPVASPPYPPVGQLFHLAAPDAAGELWFITVFFMYGQDEATLFVWSITRTEM